MAGPKYTMSPSHVALVAAPPLLFRRWTVEEDEVLLRHVAAHGTRRWSLLQQSGKLSTDRDNKACCNRYRILKKMSPQGKGGGKHERSPEDDDGEGGNCSGLESGASGERRIQSSSHLQSTSATLLSRPRGGTTESARPHSATEATTETTETTAPKFIPAHFAAVLAMTAGGIPTAMGDQVGSTPSTDPTWYTHGGLVPISQMAPCLSEGALPSSASGLGVLPQEFRPFPTGRSLLRPTVHQDGPAPPFTGSHVAALQSAGLLPRSAYAGWHLGASQVAGQSDSCRAASRAAGVDAMSPAAFRQIEQGLADSMLRTAGSLDSWRWHLALSNAKQAAERQGAANQNIITLARCAENCPSPDSSRPQPVGVPSLSRNPDTHLSLWPARPPNTHGDLLHSVNMSTLSAGGAAQYRNYSPSMMNMPPERMSKAPLENIASSCDSSMTFPSISPSSASQRLQDHLHSQLEALHAADQLPPSFPTLQSWIGPSQAVIPSSQKRCLEDEANTRLKSIRTDGDFAAWFSSPGHT